MNGKEIIDIPSEDLRTVDGVKIVHTRKIPIYDENNKPKILLGCLEDITQKTETEHALKDSEAKLKTLNADKDLFMSILAHDLRNPFNSLLGFSDLLIKNFQNYDIDKNLQLVNILNQTAHSTFELLEDILIWSQSQLGKIAFEPKKFALKDLCHELIDNQKNHAETKKILIKCKELETDICIMADLNMLKTIMRNLLSNAIKFSNEHGQIFISAEISGNYTIISVSDSGIGIDKTSQEKLWKLSKPYSTSGTAEEKGTGLGLLICKEFVEKHGGKIWVESEPGKGADFKFTIPLCIE
jgi:signal transduction histidine kinase